MTDTKSFIIRVRLENATEQQYVQFARTMTDNGYSATITSKTGQGFMLPLGNFRIETTNDKEAILDHIKSVVMTHWTKKFQILVTEVVPKGAVWTGLTEH